ncbi:MAG: hypothetical protein ACLVL7_04100 [Anaerotruncus massiliensis (ex Togo et al. 2019)]
MGADTTLAQIVAPSSCGQLQGPIAKLADKVSGVFVPVVICIAVIAAVTWLLGHTEFALSIGIAVLSSRPCAPVSHPGGDHGRHRQGARKTASPSNPPRRSRPPTIDTCARQDGHDHRGQTARHRYPDGGRPPRRS